MLTRAMMLTYHEKDTRETCAKQRKARAASAKVQKLLGSLDRASLTPDERASILRNLRVAQEMSAYASENARSSARSTAFFKRTYDRCAP